MPTIDLVVKVRWDDEAKVYYTSESTVPGLATEAPTFEELLERISAVVPELLELNGLLEPSFHGDLPIKVQAQQMTSARINH